LINSISVLALARASNYAYCMGNQISVVDSQVQVSLFLNLLFRLGGKSDKLETEK
jgi:hypothetical protein